MRTTRWSPDTCDCVIEYNIDETGNTTFKNTVKTCPAHSKHHGKTDHFSVVLEENQRKNKTLAEAAEIAGVNLNPDEVISSMSFGTEEEKIVYEQTLKEGMKVKAQKFVKEFNSSYQFDKDRKLIVNHPSMTAAQKTVLQNKTGNNVRID
jgi:hypothetical protein